MDAAHLRHFADFEAWDTGDLAAVARRARRLRVPAGRWLVRPGRTLSGCFFLVEGRIRLLEGGRSVIVNAGSARARRAVYPGSAGVETLTPAQFLNVDSTALDTVRAVQAEGLPGVPLVSVAEASWQRRFLTTPLMQRLEPVAWQRILRAMSRADYPAGAPIIEAGRQADCCYVLCSGRAEVRDAAGGRVLGVVEPGGLFGEDALVSGRARNAAVIMAAAGRVVSLPAQQFQSWLLDAVVQPLPDLQGRPVISLGGERPGAVLNVMPGRVRGAGARLSPVRRYAIVGGTWSERSLAAFLLAEQGIDAAPVARQH